MSKRSPSDSPEQPSIKQKVDHDGPEASTSTLPPLDDNTAPTTSEQQSLPLRDDESPQVNDVEEGDDRPSPPPTDDTDEEDVKPVEGVKGVDVMMLDSIVDMYQLKSLSGFPPDEQDQVLYEHNQELNDKIVIWRGDITQLDIDCIVNAANKSLLGGGGVDGAIHSAAGPRLLRECRTLNGAETGQTKLTKGYNLPARYIAHTVGPVYAKSKKVEKEQDLRSCYRSTLELCVEKGIKSVAFSGISTGVYGYPIDDAACVACDEVRRCLEGPDGSKIDRIVFCNFRQADVNAYLDNLPAYFPPPPPSTEPTTTDTTTTTNEDGERMETTNESGEKDGEES